jgi:hypothetical protein
VGGVRVSVCVRVCACVGGWVVGRWVRTCVHGCVRADAGCFGWEVVYVNKISNYLKYKYECKKRFRLYVKNV